MESRCDSNSAVVLHDTFCRVSGGMTAIKAMHVVELRNAIVALE